MTQLLSSQGVDITQRNFQQIIIRGDGKAQFNQMINFCSQKILLISGV